MNVQALTPTDQIGLNVFTNKNRLTQSLFTTLSPASSSNCASGEIYFCAAVRSDKDLFCLEVWGGKWLEVHHSHRASPLQSFTQRCCGTELELAGSSSLQYLGLEVPSLYKRCDTSIIPRFDGNSAVIPGWYFSCWEMFPSPLLHYYFHSEYYLNIQVNQCKSSPVNSINATEAFRATAPSLGRLPYSIWAPL